MVAKFKLTQKDSFMTETFLLFARFGDYLLAVEETLQSRHAAGVDDLRRFFGGFDSGTAKRFIAAHRKRYERDMAMFCRYSSVTTLYSMFEVRCRAFEAEFRKTHPEKKVLASFLTQKPAPGFVLAFRYWLENDPRPIAFPQKRIWSLLQDFQSIRNCIVHGHGDHSLVSKPHRAKAAIKRTHKATLNPRGILVLERGFAFEVCEKIGTFFQLLFASSGYRLTLPRGHAETLAKNFAGFEEEISSGIAKYRARQTINLGGQL